MSELLTF